MATPKRIIVGLTGASGLPYGIRLLERLRQAGVETHVVMSRSAKVALAYESDLKVRDVEALAGRWYDNDDIAAPISSGSFRTQGMIIAPCSAKTLGEISSGATATLISRAADVVLKERRRLVLLFRETPLHLGHIRNMAAVTEMGGILMPPVPAFYPMPASVDDIVEHSAGRALDLFDIDTGIARWKDTPDPG